MSVKVSILVLTYNRVDLSREFIPQIIDNAGNIPCEVLIWDNGSSDGSYDWAYSYGAADCRVAAVYGASENIGVEAFNTMAADARGEFIIKVDDDVTVPVNFAQRLVSAYERIGEDKLLYLGWDMSWGAHVGAGTFATRSGFSMYQGSRGRVVQLSSHERALITYNPYKWMVNGVCRLSPRDKFLAVGGHPKGIIYGADAMISATAAAHGYWIGYLNAKDLVHHRGNLDGVAYRKLKDSEMHKAAVMGRACLKQL